MKTTTRPTTATRLRGTARRLARILNDLEALVDSEEVSAYRQEIRAAVDGIYNAAAGIGIEYLRAEVEESSPPL